MGWLWGVLGIIVLVVVIIGIWSLSSKGTQYHFKEVFEYAAKNGNVPQSYSEQNLTSLYKHRFKEDTELFPWMDTLDFDLGQKMAFMLCFWYSRSLVSLGLIYDYFVEIKKEEFDFQRQEMIEKIENVESSNQMVNDAILRLKFLGLNGDVQSAQYVCELLMKQNKREQDIKLAYYWLCLLHGLDEKESIFVQAKNLVISHPQIDFQADKADALLLQDFYLDIFKKNIYIEDWQEQLEKQEQAGA